MLGQTGTWTEFRLFWILFQSPSAVQIIKVIPRYCFEDSVHIFFFFIEYEETKHCNTIIMWVRPIVGVSSLQMPGSEQLDPKLIGSSFSLVVLGVEQAWPESDQMLHVGVNNCCWLPARLCDETGQGKTESMITLKIKVDNTITLVGGIKQV